MAAVDKIALRYIAASGKQSTVKWLVASYSWLYSSSKENQLLILKRLVISYKTA
jgi:hypothetical protein